MEGERGREGREGEGDGMRERRGYSIINNQYFSSIGMSFTSLVKCSVRSFYWPKIAL